MKLKSLIFFVLLINGFSFFSAQEKKDSVYTKIEEFSDKRKFTKFLHKFIFRREADSVSVKTNESELQRKIYQGKFIGKITFETVDPFGVSSFEKAEDRKWYDRLADKVHYETRASTIKNYLLFKNGEKFNTQKIYESERLLRSMYFVNRVNIDVKNSKTSKDSVNVHVKVLDSWSLVPHLNFSGSEIGGGLSEYNFLGLGHELNLEHIVNFQDKTNYLSGGYTANNLFGSFINAQIVGEKDFEKNERINLTATREFFSPLTRWAGGFTFEFFKRKVGLPMQNTATIPEVQIKVFRQNLWSGYQFPIYDADNGRISKNIAVLGRFQNFQYKDRPQIDSVNFFKNSTSFLGSVVYTDRKFSVQKNVFRYNLQEDISYGKSLGITSGFLVRNGNTKPYLGVSASLGEIKSWGYYNIKLQFGHFFGNRVSGENQFRFDGTYFSNLHHWRFAQIRHFFSPTVAIGNDEDQNSYTNRMNLSSPSEFRPFDPDYIGTKKIVLRYQFQMFINKSWKNFHFSPYFSTAVGWLSTSNDSFFKSATHTRFGVGLLLDNPYLVFNRIQLSFMYYPKVPFGNNSLSEFNHFQNSMMPMSSFSTEVPKFVNFAD
nr:hypothetical protein [Chryseobacterium sp. R2A-55]